METLVGWGSFDRGPTRLDAGFSWPELILCIIL